MYLPVTRRAFTLTIVNDVLSVISPEALDIASAHSISLEKIAVLVNVVVISRLGDELNSVSSQGSFAPVRDPLEGQLAVGSLVD